MTKGFLSVEEKLHSCCGIFSARFAESTVMLTIVKHYAVLSDVPWQDGLSESAAGKVVYRPVRCDGFFLRMPYGAGRRFRNFGMLECMSDRAGVANLRFFAKAETSPPCALHRAPGISASGKVSVKQAPPPG
jgi:hypothetical protein